jgi:hypothetical protein
LNFVLFYSFFVNNSVAISSCGMPGHMPGLPLLYIYIFFKIKQNRKKKEEFALALVAYFLSRFLSLAESQLSPLNLFLSRPLSLSLAAAPPLSLHLAASPPLSASHSLSLSQPI